MAKAIAKTAPRVRDLVRIIQRDGKLSKQRYQIEELLESKGREPDCTISQWPSTAPKGKKMAAEPFWLSLLAVDNAVNAPLLAAMLPRIG